MQKIAFVSIVLVFGLFSLQLIVGSNLKEQITPEQAAVPSPKFNSVNYYSETNRMIYVYPSDSVIILDELRVCKPL